MVNQFSLTTLDRFARQKKKKQHNKKTNKNQEKNKQYRKWE